MALKPGRHLKIINRKTYSLLDWLGDWGGLLDALFMIAEFLVTPFSAIALKAKLMASLIRLKVPDVGLPGRQPGIEKTQRVKEKALLYTILDRCCRPKEYRLLDRSFQVIDRELDLVKMIRRVKMLVLTSLVTLSPDQRKLITRMNHVATQNKNLDTKFESSSSSSCKDEIWN